MSSGEKGLALWTDKLIQAFLEHLDNVLTFDTWSAKAFCPAQQDTVINLFLSVESLFKQHRGAIASNTHMHGYEKVKPSCNFLSNF